MKMIENQTLDEERALYGSKDLTIRNCSFDGPADGESAVKECENIWVENCFFNLRYPFWHVKGLKIQDSQMTQMCRAALWYSENIEIACTKLHGIKALRECEQARLQGCDIISPEFGWSVKGVEMEDCKAVGEYFMMRSENLKFRQVKLEGKYSFQYIKNAVFEWTGMITTSERASRCTSSGMPSGLARVPIPTIVCIPGTPGTSRSVSPTGVRWTRYTRRRSTAELRGRTDGYDAEKELFGYEKMEQIRAYARNGGCACGVLGGRFRRGRTDGLLSVQQLCVRRFRPCGGRGRL